jgi:hypothetical protein
MARLGRYGLADLSNWRDRNVRNRETRNDARTTRLASSPDRRTSERRRSSPIFPIGPHAHEQEDHRSEE